MHKVVNITPEVGQTPWWLQHCLLVVYQAISLYLQCSFHNEYCKYYMFTNSSHSQNPGHYWHSWWTQSIVCYQRFCLVCLAPDSSHIYCISAEVFPGAIILQVDHFSITIASFEQSKFKHTPCPYLSSMRHTARITGSSRQPATKSRARTNSAWEPTATSSQRGRHTMGPILLIHQGNVRSG